MNVKLKEHYGLYIGGKSPPWAVRWNRPFSLCHADQRKDFLSKEHHNAARQSEKALASLGCIVALDGQAHLHNAPAHQNNTHGLNQAENEAGQVGNNGDGVRGEGADGQPQRQQSENRKALVDTLNFRVVHLGSSLKICASSSTLDSSS